MKLSTRSSQNTTTIRRSTSDHVIYYISSQIDQNQQSSQSQQPHSLPTYPETTNSSQSVAPTYSEAIKFSVLNEKQQDENKEEELLPSYQDTLKTVS